MPLFVALLLLAAVFAVVARLLVVYTQRITDVALLSAPEVFDPPKT